MESAVHVGNKIEKATAENLKEIIETILRVGHETRMEQDTIREAIQMVGRVVEVKQVTITGSTFTGDKIVNMDSDSTGHPL